MLVRQHLSISWTSSTQTDKFRAGLKLRPCSITQTDITLGVRRNEVGLRGFNRHLAREKLVHLNAPSIRVGSGIIDGALSRRQSDRPLEGCSWPAKMKMMQAHSCRIHKYCLRF
jgi:hypothetical protein